MKVCKTLHGYSTDKRKRRNQHRNMAKHLLTSGSFLSAKTRIGSTLWFVAKWHLDNARYLGR